MTDRDLEIELSALRAVVHEAKEALGLLAGGTGLSLGGYIRQDRAELAALQGELAAVKAERDDWREIATGLYEFGGVPLIQDALRYAEVVARYEAKIKKGGA